MRRAPRRRSAQHASKIEQQSDDVRTALARLLGQTQAALSVAADAAPDAA